MMGADDAYELEKSIALDRAEEMAELLGAALRVVRADIAMDPKKWSQGTVDIVNDAWAKFAEWSES